MVGTDAGVDEEHAFKPSVAAVLGPAPPDAALNNSGLFARFALNNRPQHNGLPAAAGMRKAPLPLAPTYPSATAGAHAKPEMSMYTAGNAVAAHHISGQSTHLDDDIAVGNGTASNGFVNGSGSAAAGDGWISKPGRRGAVLSSPPSPNHNQPAAALGTQSLSHLPPRPQPRLRHAPAPMRPQQPSPSPPPQQPQQPQEQQQQQRRKAVIEDSDEEGTAGPAVSRKRPAVMMESPSPQPESMSTFGRPASVPSGLTASGSRADLTFGPPPVIPGAPFLQQLNAHPASSSDSEAAFVNKRLKRLEGISMPSGLGNLPRPNSGSSLLQGPLRSLALQDAGAFQEAAQRELLARAQQQYQLQQQQQQRLLQSHHYPAHGFAGLLGDDGPNADTADEPEEAEEEKEDVLAQCERISAQLRDMLAGGGSDTGGGLVTQAQLVAACGEQAEKLKTYQLVGINFLVQLYKQKVGGAIMADEMGLGKTAQTICFLGMLGQLGDPGPHLIVVPASLIDNWQRELDTWCPDLRVAVYYGKEREDIRHVLNDWRRRVAIAKDDNSLEATPSCFVHPLTTADGPQGMDRLRAIRGGDAEAAQEEEDILGWQLPPSTSGENPFDVMLTTYTLFEREGETYREDRSFLTKWMWSHLVMDEAHALKNRRSTRATKLRKVAQSCKHRIMLTGTPLQNDVGELANLLEFLLPNLFEEEAARLEEAATAQGEDAEAAVAQRMKKLLEPFIMRRLKSEVADQLAAKQHKTELLTMTDEQSALYISAVEGLRAEAAAAAAAAAAALEAKAAAKSAAAARSAAKKRGKKGAEDNGLGPDVLNAAEAADAVAVVSKLGGATKANNIFTHLRKVAQHPLLIRAQYTRAKVAAMAQIASSRGLFGGDCREDRVMAELEGYSDLQLHNFAAAHPRHLSAYMLDPSAVMASCKCRYLAELLPRLRASGSRVLIFSQWTSTLDVLEWFLRQRDMPFCRLDGSTQVETRLSLVDQFNDPKNGLFIFLLSTRAGGQGLNLTGADTVILHDVDFNPSIDRQAEDRCHRLGQTKPVTIYRLITRDSVDQSIMDIAERKKALDASILEGLSVSNAPEDEDEGASNKKKTKKGGGGDSGGDARAIGAILARLLAGSNTA